MKFSVTCVLVAIYTATTCHGIHPSFYDPFQWGYYNNQNFGNTGYNGHQQHQPGRHTECPEQTDYSAGLLLSSDTLGYPETAIDSELSVRADLKTCFVLEEVPKGSPSIPPPDNTLAGSKYTCPATSQVLRSFFRFNGRCWMIEKVQDVLNFTVCKTKSCLNCGSSNSHAYGGYPSYGHGNAGSGVMETRCFKEFLYYSVWVYCEGLSPNRRIVRQRVILPNACGCYKVQCHHRNNSPYYGRKR